METITPFKQIIPTDHFGWHRAYLDVYAEIFAPLKDLEKPLLEIGVYEGGGLLMYADYFKESHIIGFDPYANAPAVKGLSQISLFEIDAYTDDALEIARSQGPFGVIIDDGPHCEGSQTWFVRHYPPFLADNGIAIVEDIPDDTRRQILIDAVHEGFKWEVRDLRPINGRYDDILLLIRKQ